MWCMFFVMFILMLFDQIKHVKLLSECINVLFYIIEAWIMFHY
jgi:hypothetical protein